MKAAIFFIGLLIGSLIGIVFMCLVQINRHTENELRKVERSCSEVSSETEN